MSPQESWKPLESGELQEWRKMISDYPGQPYFKFVKQADLPISIPTTLRDKINHGVVMASGTSEGNIILVCNLCRVDAKDSAIDQQPFALVVDSLGNAPSGMYLQHGDWLDRTTHPPQQFWDAVAESGVGGFFCPLIPQGCESGTLESLPESSHGQAFNEMVSRFRSKGCLNDSNLM